MILILLFLLFICFLGSTPLDNFLLGKADTIDTLFFLVPFSFIVSIFSYWECKFSISGAIIGIVASIIFYRFIYLPHRYKRN